VCGCEHVFFACLLDWCFFSNRSPSLSSCTSVSPLFPTTTENFGVTGTLPRELGFLPTLITLNFGTLLFQNVDTCPSFSIYLGRPLHCIFCLSLNRIPELNDIEGTLPKEYGLLGNLINMFLCTSIITVVISFR
jgi:hypothetical protein